MQDLIAELLLIERAAWPEIQARIPDWHPRNEGEEETEETEEAEEAEEVHGSADDLDWKAAARKHERAAKRDRKARDDLEKRLREREDADKSEHEKAVAAAREDGEKTARTAAEKERRADRLETAAIRAASRGFKVEGEDGDITVRFADPDDAHTYVERMVRRGELDEDELYGEDGRVNTEALAEALTELLASKPHLAAGAAEGNGKAPKVKGSADGGKGSSGPKDAGDLSPAQWLEKIKK